MPPSATFDDANAVAPLPQALRQRFGSTWQVLGHGLFTWSVFRVYRAALHVTDEGLSAGSPFVLDLNYLRNVSAAQIAQTAAQEMQRLTDMTAPTAAKWGQVLEGLLPDVGLGDRLLGVFEPGVGVHFYFGEKSLGAIEDAGFAAAFAAVWLDERTRAPGLRAQLLALQAVQ
jgi:hypothetical protein